VGDRTIRLWKGWSDPSPETFSGVKPILPALDGCYWSCWDDVDDLSPAKLLANQMPMIVTTRMIGERLLLLFEEYCYSVLRRWNCRPPTMKFVHGGNCSYTNLRRRCDKRLLRRPVLVVKMWNAGMSCWRSRLQVNIVSPWT
jgi:hypothetical protein